MLPSLPAAERGELGSELATEAALQTTAVPPPRALVSRFLSSSANHHGTQKTNHITWRRQILVSLSNTDYLTLGKS